MTKTQLIADMSQHGIPTSPYMHYWDDAEVLRYYLKHSTHHPQVT